MTNENRLKNETNNETRPATAKPVSPSAWRWYVVIPGVSTLAVVLMLVLGIGQAQQLSEQQKQLGQQTATQHSVYFEPDDVVSTSTDGYSQTIAVIDEKQYLLDIADTPDLRTQGLSGRETLEDNRGMLFVFQRAGVVGIWMKDMHVPLDILWLDEHKQVVHIEHHVSPDTYPKTFQPLVAARYVIELPAGSIEQ